MTAALELVDIVKTYDGEPPVRALDHVSLRVDRGEMVGIVGPSGSGKSTLLHIIGTLDRPTSGEVQLGGIATSKLSDRQLSAVRSQMLGFVFQQFFLHRRHQRGGQRGQRSALSRRAARPSAAPQRSRRWSASGSRIGCTTCRTS